MWHYTGFLGKGLILKRIRRERGLFWILLGRMWNYKGFLGKGFILIRIRKGKGLIVDTAGAEVAL